VLKVISRFGPSDLLGHHQISSLYRGTTENIKCNVQN